MTSSKTMAKVAYIPTRGAYLFSFVLCVTGHSRILAQDPRRETRPGYTITFKEVREVVYELF